MVLILLLTIFWVIDMGIFGVDKHVEAVWTRLRVVHALNIIHIIHNKRL